MTFNTPQPQIESALLRRLIEFEETEANVDEASTLGKFTRLLYASKDEPDLNTPLGGRLFPNAHEGNVRRLLRFAHSPENTHDVSGSTQAWMGLWFLMQTGIAAYNIRSFSAFARYVEQLTGLKLKFRPSNLHDFWKLDPRQWQKNLRPDNYAQVMQWLAIVHHCSFDKQGRVDSLLLPPRNHPTSLTPRGK